MRPCRLLPVLRERNRHTHIASLGGVVDAISLVPVDLLALIAVRSSELLLVAELLLGSVRDTWSRPHTSDP
jgi:hypothetical protein